MGGPALIAFLAMILFGGSNAIAVRFSNAALPPFWGATIRFVLTGVLFWTWVALARISIPRGRALVGSMAVGVLNSGVNYALLYWALLVVPASLTMVILALGPLLTFFLAWAHGQEAFRWRGLIGAIIAFGGIVVAAGGGSWHDDSIAARPRGRGIGGDGGRRVDLVQVHSPNEPGGGECGGGDRWGRDPDGHLVDCW